MFPNESNPKILIPGFLLAILAGMAVSPAAADVAFANLFGNHMVLQRDVPVPVRGTANPGEPVTVSFNGQTVVGSGDDSNSWSVTLASMPYNATGQTLSAQGPGNSATCTDVVVGDVYVCSGQSNMEYQLQASSPDGWTDAGSVSIADIRMLRMSSSNVTQCQQFPQADIPAGINWFTCIPANQGSIGSFSGLAFYFARDLYAARGIPLGLIEAAYGGMTAEIFMSLEILQAEPALAAGIPGTFNPAPTSNWSTGLFNAMIAPLTRFPIRGVLWDQGESNESIYSSHFPGTAYKTLLPCLIKDWRMKWNSQFNFYIIQLQNMSRFSSPGVYYSWSDPAACQTEVGWADVQWGQFNTLKVPGTGMSVNYDLNPNALQYDAGLAYHPPNKEAFAARIAPWAIRQVYGPSDSPLTFTGPLYESCEVQGSDVVLHFAFPNATPVLSTNNGQPVTGFQIAPQGTTNYVWANASLEGDSVRVSHPSVPTPGTVRYAWSYNAVDVNGPVANLSDAQSFLSSPFQTEVFSDVFVTGNAVTIQDLDMTPAAGDGTDFGTTGLDQPVTHDFAIVNEAGAGLPLTLTGGASRVRLAGADASYFTIVTQPSSAVVVAGGSITFQVAFDPAGEEGLRQAMLQIPNNTPHKTPYTLYIQAAGVNLYTPTQTPSGTWYTSTPTPTKTPTVTYTRTLTPAIQVDMIDDYENTAMEPQNLWGGSWATNKDTDSTIALGYVSPGANGTAWAVSVYGNIGTSNWSNYYSCLYSGCGPYDAAAAGITGLEFWFYGDGHSYRAMIQTVGVVDYNYYGKTITPAAGEWTFVRIPFSEMTREAGWGTQTPAVPVTVNPSDVTGVRFDTKFTGAFYYLVDQVGFYRVLPTLTPTPTDTPTFTETPTGTWYTATFTDTATPTPTATLTATVTPTPTVTPTLTWTGTPTGTWYTPTLTVTNTPRPPDTSTYPFEGGTSGWAQKLNAVTDLSYSTATAYLGTGSLQCAVSCSAAGADGQVGIEPLPGSNWVNATITAHLWAPADLPDGCTVHVYVKGVGWSWLEGPHVTLVKDAWNTLTFGPSTDSNMSGVLGVGIKIVYSDAWIGTMFVDSVNVVLPPTPTRTHTATRTATLSPTATWSPTITRSPTPSPTATSSYTPTDSVTPTLTRTMTATPTVTATVTLTSTDSATPSPTTTFTSSMTATSTFTPSPTNTAVNTSTPVPTAIPAMICNQVLAVGKNVFRPEEDPAVEIRYCVDTPGPVRLAVYNMAGEMIALLWSGTPEKGTYPLTWSGRNKSGETVASGIYLLVMEYRQGRWVKKILLIH